MSVFTIGTSNRTESNFFGELNRRDVRTIIDVRSKPWSRVPHFRQSALVRAANAHGLAYLEMGEVFGGLNDIRTDDVAYLAALDRLLAAEAMGSVAIFCAEGHPTECHRVWKVGAALLVHREIDPINILRDGREERVSRTLLRTKPDSISPCIRDEALRVAFIRATA